MFRSVNPTTFFKKEFPTFEEEMEVFANTLPECKWDQPYELGRQSKDDLEVSLCKMQASQEAD